MKSLIAALVIVLASTLAAVAPTQAARWPAGDGAPRVQQQADICLACLDHHNGSQWNGSQWNGTHPSELQWG